MQIPVVDIMAGKADLLSLELARTAYGTCSVFLGDFMDIGGAYCVMTPVAWATPVLGAYNRNNRNLQG